MIAKIILIAFFASVALAATDCAADYTCVQLGGACSATAFCNTDTSYCDGAKCVALIAIGSPCTLLQECAGNGFCNNGTCTAQTFAGEGASCAAAGTLCSRSNNYCNLNTKVCTRQPAIGAACDVTLSTDICQENAVCAGTAGSTTCMQIGTVAVGNACYGRTSLCNAGSYCDVLSGNCKAASTSSNTPCSASGTRNQTVCTPNNEICGCNTGNTGNYACYSAAGNVQNTINLNNAYGSCLFNNGCDRSGSEFTCAACKSQFCAYAKDQAAQFSSVQKCIYPEIDRTLAYCNGAASVVASFAMIFVALLVVM